MTAQEKINFSNYFSPENSVNSNGFTEKGDKKDHIDVQKNSGQTSCQAKITGIHTKHQQKKIYIVHNQLIYFSYR